MTMNQSIAAHYQHGNLLVAIESALIKMGKSRGAVSIADLSAVDEFHIGGRVATEHLMDKLHLTSAKTILDVGCGLGGAARFVAQHYDKKVIGIDLTTDFIQTGNELSKWVGLTDRVNLFAGNAINMPFQDGLFERAYMLHVGMNIEPKRCLFEDVYRVLKPNAYLGVYDLMRVNDGQLSYPVPWAENEHNCQLATLKQYIQALTESGFEVINTENRLEFSLQVFESQRNLNRQNLTKSAKPLLSLHTLIKKDPALKFGNLLKNITADLVAPVEIIAFKK